MSEYEGFNDRIHMSVAVCDLCILRSTKGKKFDN